MLRTRLWMGAILVALIVAMLLVDQAPWFPFLFVLFLVFSLAGTVELLGLLGPGKKLPTSLIYCSIALLVVGNWLANVPELSRHLNPNPWFWVQSLFALAVLAAFLNEMRVFQEPGESVTRIALTIWCVIYLGLLPSFFVQIRWLWDPATEKGLDLGVAALALTVFVPKCCDIGAYFTGRLLGKHRMTPVLSPKKTWEGAAGGLVAAMLTAVAINRLGPAPVLGTCVGLELLFGSLLGLAGMLGDLAESLIKRDCRQKDASQVVPGFGGVLDVVDAILFAAPVAFWWFSWVPYIHD